MRERQLIDAIHRRLPKPLHRQSMTMGAMTQNGTPDYYYDGPKRDLWVEYKQVNSIPRDLVVVPALTELQKRWLQRRWEHGHNAKVVVGLPYKRALVFEYPAQWGRGIKLDVAGSGTYDEVAMWISDFCGCCSGREAR